MSVYYSIRVYGKVQGVFYRASTKEKAEALGIKGWVKNETDGSVSIGAEGPESQMKALLEWCKRGPTHAKVEKIDYQEEDLKGFVRFEVKR